MFVIFGSIVEWLSLPAWKRKNEEKKNPTRFCQQKKWKFFASLHKCKVSKLRLIYLAVNFRQLFILSLPGKPKNIFFLGSPPHWISVQIAENGIGPKCDERWTFSFNFSGVLLVHFCDQCLNIKVWDFYKKRWVNSGCLHGCLEG